MVELDNEGPLYRVCSFQILQNVCIHFKRPILQTAKQKQLTVNSKYILYLRHLYRSSVNLEEKTF